MPLPTDSTWIAAATCFAVAGTIVVFALLAVEYFAARWSWCTSLVTSLGLAVASAAAVAWTGTWEIAAALGLVLVGTMLALAARTRLVQGALLLVTRPGAIMASLLMLSIAAGVYVNWAAHATSSCDVDLPLVAGAGFHSIDGLVAVTDLGQPLPLIAYDDEESLGEVERQYLGAKSFEHQIIRIAGPSTACNCHGWVYTGGRFAIQSRYIDDLLSDNGYVVVEQPQPDDLVIYRGPAGTVEHTGLVRLAGKDGLVLVESKWGPLGVYLHPVDSQPYGTSRGFYRSPRAGHLVSIVPQGSVPETRLPALARLHPTGADEIDASATVRRLRSGEAKVYERPILRIPGQRKG